MARALRPQHFTYPNLHSSKISLNKRSTKSPIVLLLALHASQQIGAPFFLFSILKTKPQSDAMIKLPRRKNLASWITSLSPPFSMAARQRLMNPRHKPSTSYILFTYIFDSMHEHPRLI